MPVYACTINAVSVALTMADRFRISAPLNGIASAELELWQDTPTGLPDFDQEVIITEDAVPIFGGTISQPTIVGVSDTSSAVRCRVLAHDFNKIAQRRYVGVATVPAGTLKQALQFIVPYLPGVTLDAGQVDGPSLAAFDVQYWKAQAFLDYLTSTTGYVWKINASKVLTMFAPGTLSAPFNLADGDAHAFSDLPVTTVRDDYANVVNVLGAGVIGTAQGTGSHDPTTGLYGRWELLVQSPEATQAVADALAAQLLAAHLVSGKEVEYITHETGILPGQIQTIVSSYRGVNAIFLITEVSIDYAGGLAQRRVRAIEGQVYSTGWREKTRNLFGGGGIGVVSTGGGGGGGGSSAQRYAYPLGGSQSDAVSSPTPTWVDASPNQVLINTVARQTTSVTVVLQLRAVSAGVSVQARLFDLAAGAPCPGVSALVTSTTWQTVTFSTTVTAGSTLVKLQVLPGTADEPVQAVGYVE